MLSGGRVVWAERAGSTMSIVDARTPVGRDVLYSRAPADDRTSVWFEELAASSRLVAVREVETYCPPFAPSDSGGSIGRSCIVSRRVVAGPPGGPLAPLEKPHGCGGGQLSVSGVDDSLAAKAVTLAISETYEADCAGGAERFRHRLLLVSGRTRIVLVDSSAESPHASGIVRLAGRFVAWSEHRGRRLVVYDRRPRRVVYRVQLRRRSVVGSGADFDLQADGAVAVAWQIAARDGVASSRVAWWSVRAPRAHVLELRSRDATVQIARSRIALWRAVDARTSELDLVDLGGHVTRIVRFTGAVEPTRGVDFDGRRIAWAASRITSSRVDCPPPPSGLPCRRVRSGVAWISVLRLGDARARVVSRQPFVDVPG